MNDIHTIHRELTQWHTRREPYTHESKGTTWETHHITQVPPLIQQLDEADPSNTGAAYRATPGSRPPASLEALDTLAMIDNEAGEWVRKLGHDDPGSTIGCISKLHGLAASAEFCGHPKPEMGDVDMRIMIDGKWETRKRKEAVCCVVHKIERAMRRWWTQARIASGIDTPAWAPNNTCPMCGHRRTLRIRGDDQTAFCTNCRETWTRSNIGLLAEHVRHENGEELVS